MKKTLYGQSVLWVFQKGIISAHLPDIAQLKVARALAVAQGALVTKLYVNNLIVTAGKGLIADLLLGDETVGLGYHSIGTGSTTPAITDTTLDTEVARKAFATSSRTGNVFEASVFYTAAESTYNIGECGIFGGSGASLTLDSGTLFSHYLQAYDNSLGNYDLTFDYSLTIG